MTTFSAPKPDPRPPFPLPDVLLLLSRFGDTAEPYIPASLLSAYRSAITNLLTPTETQSLIDSLPDKDTNWTNTWFLNLLLAGRSPVANSARISILVAAPGESREAKIAGLLRAVGVWSREYVFSERPDEESLYTPAQRLLEWQLRGLCAAFRAPRNRETCEMVYVGPEKAKHAVVWHRGAAWRVQVVDEEGVVLEVGVIERQLLDIVRVQKKTSSVLPQVAAMSWRLGRSEWFGCKTELEKIPENQEYFSTLYTSLITVALEEHAAPVDMAERLNDVRMGESSENRFADQTLGIVSYSDGTTGLTFDHAPSDCGPALELSTLLLTLTNTSSAFPSSNGTPAAYVATPLSFMPAAVPTLYPPTLTEPIPRRVLTSKIPSSSRPHLHRRLTDTVMCLAVQAAVLRSTGTIPPLFQPVQLKRFRHGRCDSMTPVSTESVSFLSLAFPPTPPADPAAHKEDLGNAFAAVVKKRRNIIADILDGTISKYFRQAYIYPHLCSLRTAGNATPGQLAVIEVLDAVSGSVIVGEGGAATTVQFTGFTTTTDDIQAGLSNIFLPNQLVVFYLQRPGGAAVAWSGTGVMEEQLEGVVRSFEECYNVIAEVADQYAEHLAGRG